MQIIGEAIDGFD